MTTFKQQYTSQTTAAASSAIEWEGGLGHMVVTGTFDGATVALQISPDDGSTWQDVGGDASITAAGAVSFEINPCQLRLNLTSAGGSTSVNGWVTRGSEGSGKT